MKKVTTADRSVTFFNEEVQEHYHAVNVGAVKEAMKKFVEPCSIAELAELGEIVILDVCFGLGYNSAAAIDVALQANPECKLRIIGLEKDVAIVNKMKELHPPLEHYDILQRLSKNRTVTEGNVTATLLVGDARETIHDVATKVDVVFFDPFSPKKQPELWTVDVFKAIKQRMRPGGVLATYSCAKVVRENLEKAGFDVQDSVVIGRRGPATVAFA